MLGELVNNLGYFGKVPTHGDFVTRGLPRSFIDPWDLWLQEAIVTSRQQMGDDWLNHFLTSPIYHFALSPGICGENGWIGVLMPSVDRIGRYYPMTLSLMTQHCNNPFIALQNQEWFIRMETLALSCLHDDYDLDEFNRGIDGWQEGSESIPAEPLPLTAMMTHREPHRSWRQPLAHTDALSDLLPSILDLILKERCFAYSLWWTAGSAQISASLLFSEGLPPIDGVAAMFDGNWQKWGWQDDNALHPFLKSRPQHDLNE